MKHIILLSSLLVFLFSLTFSQEKKVELIKNSNTNINIDENSPVVKPSKISRAIYFDSYGPLKDLPKVDASYYIKNKNKLPWDRRYDKTGADYSNWTDQGPDPVWQKEQGTVINSKAIDQNFRGQDSPYLPSDANGTIGPNHYMQTVNCTYEIYNRTGTSLAGPTAMNTLFAGVAGASENDGDPLILWDEQAQKWLAVEFSIGGTPDYMLIAVSQTNDPTGLWWRWSFIMNGMPDYEKIGIWEDGYYMATNTYTGDDVYVFEREQMIIGGASPQVIQFENPNRPNPSGFHCIMPFDCDGTFAPSGTPGQYITINDDAWGGNDELWVFECDVDWTTPSNSTFGRTQQISVSSFDSQFNPFGTGDIAQSGTTQLVDAIPYVLQIRAQYKNWGTSQSIVCTHVVDVDATNHAGLRWYELENTGSGWSIKQEGTYAPDEHSRWEVSIAMNDFGQIAMGYNISSSAMSPEIRYCGQSSCASSGVMDIAEVSIPTDLTPLSQGTGSYRNRWGDYSLITVDPSDNYTFWYTTEYWNSGKKTQITSFTLDESCNPPSVSDATPTSLYKDRGKQITITGSDLLGSTATIGGIAGSTVSNDGSTMVVDFLPDDYPNGTLTVTNGAGSDNGPAVTINTRTTILVDASTGINTDLHQTIDGAVDGLYGWLDNSVFTTDYIIDVTTGTYAESVTLNSELNPTSSNTLTIQNSSGTSPVVNATGNNYGFDLSTVDYVTLTGFAVHSADLANIYVQGDNCEVYYNKVYNALSASGIKLETGTTNNIHNNLIYNNERYAVHIVNSNSNNIENNTTYTNGGSSNPPQDVTLFFDDFELNPSTDWTLGSGWGWYTGIPYSGVSMMGHTNATSTLQKTSSINVSGYTNIEIECYARSYGDGVTLEADDHLTGEYSFDGGAWTQFFTIADDNTTYTRYGTVAPIAGSYSTLDIRFTSKVNNREYWLTEDVKVIADDATPAGNIGSELYVQSGTGTTVENNIFYVKNGSDYYAVQTESGVTVSSDYNTYYPNGNANLFNYNGTIDNTGPISANDITSDPDFVTAGTDFHINSTADSYHNGEWPPSTATGGTWTTDASNSPAIDAGNPADGYANEPANNGNCINQGAYGNTVQASKSGSGGAISWDGSTGSDWQTTANWTPEQIPNAGNNVVIPNSCPNYPVIDNGIGNVAVCNNITIENSASLTIDVDGYMTVSGSITNNAGNAGLLINSDAGGTASLIQNTSGGVDATVQLYFEASPEQWHMLSSPINNAPLSLFPTTNNLYFYDESTDDFWIGNTYGSSSILGWTSPTGNLENNLGYLYYYYQTTLNFTGQLNDNTSTSSININYTDHEGTGNGEPINYYDMDGWNFIGNPYTSAVDWTVADAGAANLYDAVYFYDGTTFKSWVNGNDSWDGASTNGGTQYIPAMQGFFIKGNIALGTGGTLNIPASARVHNDQAFWKNKYYETPQDFLRMTVEADGYTDEAIVRFLAPATYELDDKMDAYKRLSLNDAVPQIYTNASGETEYSINSIPYFDNSVSIPVKFYYSGESYSLNFTEFNFPDIKVYLKDNLLGETIEAGLNDSFNLTAHESDDIDRFELIFENSQISVPQTFNTSVVLFPNPNTGTFWLTAGNNDSGFTVEITNVTGQIVYKNTFENNITKEISMKSKSRGVYFVKIKFSDNTIVNRKIVIK